MLQGLFGNASEIDSKELQRELDATLIEGEEVINYPAASGRGIGPLK